MNWSMMPTTVALLTTLIGCLYKSADDGDDDDDDDNDDQDVHVQTAGSWDVSKVIRVPLRVLLKEPMKVL